MSPQNARVSTLYWLIGLNVVLLFAWGGTAIYTNHLRVQMAEAEQRSYEGCVRGNVLREIARYAMEQLGSPERAAQPEVAEQPCAQLYPGGKG